MKSVRSGVLLFVLAVGCGGARLVQIQPSTVLIAQAQDPAEVRAAVVRALAARGFRPEADEAGNLVAVSARRGQDLRLQIVYGPSQFQINYLSSDGFGFTPGAGAGMIQPRYQRIVADLGRSITEELGRPAREAAAALAAQRAHDEEMARASRPVIVQQAGPTVVMQGPPGEMPPPRRTSVGVSVNGGVGVQVNGVGVEVGGGSVGVQVGGVGVGVGGGSLQVNTPGVSVGVSAH